MPEKLTEKQQIAIWYVRLRWGAIVILLLVLMTSIYPGRLLFPLFPSLAIIAAAAIYNFLYPFMLKRLSFFSEHWFFTYLRASLDILVISLLVHFTGGVESPFAFMYIIELGTLAFFSYEQIAYLLAAQSAIMYVIVCHLEAYSLIAHYRLIPLPGTLYLSLSYGLSKAFSLFLISSLMIYIASYVADRLRDKQKQIEALNDAQVDFVNIVMHETKSPLTSIIGYTDILSSGSLGEVAEKFRSPLNVIKRQSNRILSMVNDLLDLARLESGRTKIEKKPVNIVVLANRLQDEFGPALNAKNLKLVLEADPGTPPVNLDEDKVLAVLANLLSNAIKFSNEGGRIFLTITPEAKEVLVAMRDEGIGIRPADLPHIFEKFYRASKEAADRKGTGLGLALSRKIIESHDGKLWAVSAGQDQGAVFYFTLPL